MVCTANDLLGWKDFPKGLRVLLLDEDSTSAAEVRSKLEEMDYVVSTFYHEDEALSAISSDSKGFHVAIVKVRAENKDGRFNFLESAKDLPTIMTSDVNCLSTMMKCLALGAVEFLEKPLSEDKLRNIWQHVAHKAFNAGPKDQSEPFKSQNPSFDSVRAVHLQSEDRIKEEFIQNQEHNEDISIESDKYPAPSTPQLKQGIRLVESGDCQDQDQISESKFVENTSDDLAAEINVEKEGFFKNSSNECCPDLTSDDKQRNEASRRHNSRGNKSSRRKIKVDWTSDLHKKFVQAVEQLGVDQAIPSRILELMNVEGLTRHNVASHLQKYRLQRRQILPKESGRKWPQTRHSTPRGYYGQRPIIAYPSYHSGGQVYPGWVPTPHGYPVRPQMWGPQYYPAWQSSESWQWSPYSGVHADAWGCPTVPPHPPFPQNASKFQTQDPVQNRQTIPKNSCDNYPGDEVIDKVVKEAINKPWLPLPLGLKPPSTESVISELSKQGISTVPPPRINTSRRR